jgi:aryl-alcohol dehydrogenase-like predicted oxidoreductase
MIVRKAIEKYKIPREKLVILTKCFGTVCDDPYAGRTAPKSESTKEYVNKRGYYLQNLLLTYQD